LQKRTFFGLGETIGFVAIVCRAVPQIDDSPNQITERVKNDLAFINPIVHQDRFVFQSNDWAIVTIEIR
jgi:hypothetical protein